MHPFVQAKNHPRKGVTIKVQPIRSRKAIRTIKKILDDHPRNFCLFVLGINTALRASELLSIKIGQVKELNVGEHFDLKESKTGKSRRITLNRPCVNAIDVLLKERAKKGFNDTDLLFVGQRGPMTVGYVHFLVKSWVQDINLKGNYGSHTLRKTFGYHQRVTFNVSLPVLVKVFGHATQKQTLDYLCIQQDEIKAVYMNEL